jgi:segregation and condensation protein B
MRMWGQITLDVGPLAHSADMPPRDWTGTVGWRRLWQLHNTQPLVPATSDASFEIPSTRRRDGRLARIEAVLYLAREPLSSRKIARFASLADGTEARTLVRQLNRTLDEGESAFRIEEVAGGFQLMTRPQFGPWLRRLLRAPIETRLSHAALETLAVVAYRQPVLRAEVEAIRGAQSGDLLRQLMERDLVRICGRADELGRPLAYGTTKRFLQIFGLRQLDDLPRADALRRESTERASETMPGESRASRTSETSQCLDEEEAK